MYRLIFILLNTLWWATYRAYMRSAKWRRLRVRRWNLAQGHCEACFNPMGTGWQLHHETYEHVGNERIEEVRALHRGCHARKHGRAL